MSLCWISAALAQSGAEADVTAADLVASRAPVVAISNDRVTVTAFLPDVKQGFYRGTRIDWSGVVKSLKVAGHEYYGLWFSKISPAVRDFQYDQDDIVVGPNSAITGPVEEFSPDGPLGWSNAKAGAVVVKIGVGALRRPDEDKYDRFRRYELVDAGHWVVRAGRTKVSFIQTLDAPGAGYKYIYQKTLRLDKRSTRLTIMHSLKNTGPKVIETSLYDHNFVTFDGGGIGSGISLGAPFDIKSASLSIPDSVQIQGQKLLVLRQLRDRDRISLPLTGFGQSPSDYRIELASQHPAMSVV